MNFYLPVEFLVIGTSIVLRKQVVTNKEVAEYRKRCTIPLEWDSENKFYYCQYDENTDIYTIQDNLQLHPQIIQILMSI